MNIKGIIWAGLYVEDLWRAVVFYQDVLGLRFIRKGDAWAHFTDPEGNRLEIKEIP